MRTGRPPAGLDHVDVLQGDAMSKERLRVVFATLAGVLTIDQACSVLRISPSRFHALRQQALQGALTAIRPRRPGRPPKTPPTADAAWVARLEEEVTSLRTEVEAWRVRAQVAQLGGTGPAREKKNEPKRKSSGKPLRRPGPRGPA